MDDKKIEIIVEEGVELPDLTKQPLRALRPFHWGIKAKQVQRRIEELKRNQPPARASNQKPQ